MLGGCKDCPPGSRRPVVKRRGRAPRCATHDREFSKRNSEARWAKRIFDDYGLTAEQYYAILQIQGGRCYICRRATGATKRLAVDHNHQTGEVRGLLCGSCNRGVIGHLREEIEAFERCIQYLTDPPARQVLRRTP